MTPEARIAAVQAALDRPLVAAYGDQVPFHYGAVIKWRDHGPDPLDGISVYWSDVGPHWHYVSWGLTELDDKVAPNPDVSGWGFELTFRLEAPAELRAQARLPGQFGARHPLSTTAAPTWPIGMLNTLARTVWERSTGFHPGESIGFGAPPDPRIAGACLVRDPLGTVETLNGKMLFLQVVGLVSREELAAARRESDADRLLEMLRGSDGLYITRPDRAPLSGTSV